MEKATVKMPQDTAKIAEAAKNLKSGGVVGLPTETVWGLASALDSPEGVRKLMRLKNRNLDSGKVFTLVPENVADISRFALIPAAAKTLISEYFPGPLTLILPKNPNFHHFYYDHFDTIGVRIPDFPLFYELLPLSGPLLLTSANRRGETPADSSLKLRQLMPELDYIVDGSASGESPSTIVDFSGPTPVILRSGNLKVTL